MGEGLRGIHNIVGTLVVAAFLLLTVLNALRVAGRDIPATRPLSMVAAGLLLIQYLLGFLLLGQGLPLNPAHVLVALAAILTVGLEHGFAATRRTERDRAVAALAATLATTVLVGIAHGIGSAPPGLLAPLGAAVVGLVRQGG